VSHYYLDASALVKRYVDEVGSDWLRTIIVSTRPLLLSLKPTFVGTIFTNLTDMGK